MRTLVLGLLVATASVVATGARQAGVHYPLDLTLDATFTAGATTIASKVTIQVTRPMESPLRTSVTDALLHGGYSNFVNALRPVLSVGSIKTQSNTVPIRYTREDPDGSATRLILIADSPLVFLGSDPTRSRAGYELTLVNLRFDSQGGVTGQMAGAAKVKPSPDGVVLDNYADQLVQLTGRVPQP
jgi:hypothetical protein